VTEIFFFCFIWGKWSRIAHISYQ